MSLRAIYYDTETTGIKPDRAHIIEIAAYDPVMSRSFERLINPGCPIPKEASAIHHISDSMVADAPPFSQVAEEFITFCEGDVVLIAHNNDNFDVHFLRNEFSRCNMPMPEWKFFDTLKWARRYRPDLPRHTLQFLRETYGVASNNAHRALDDVLVMHQVFSMMIDNLSIEEVCSLMQRPPKDLLSMPWGKHQGKPLEQIPRDYIRWLSSSGAFDKAENHQLRSCFEKLGFLAPEKTT